MKLWWQSKTIWIQMLGAVANTVALALPLLTSLPLDAMMYFTIFIALNMVLQILQAIVRVLDAPTKVVSKKTLEATREPNPLGDV